MIRERPDVTLNQAAAQDRAQSVTGIIADEVGDQRWDEVSATEQRMQRCFERRCVSKYSFPKSRADERPLSVRLKKPVVQPKRPLTLKASAKPIDGPAPTHPVPA